MKTRPVASLAAALVLAGSAAALAQNDFTLTIRAQDGSIWSDSVVLGKYAAASDLVADSLAPDLVEAELPPPAPAGPNQAADIRIVHPEGGTGYGQGTGVDVRELTSDYQRNVYRIVFRRSDPEGFQFVLSWPEGLDTVSGGGFFLTDGLGGFLFPPVDMTEVTMFAHPSWNSLSGGFAEIVIGDGRMLRTFTRDSIALAADYKGKVGKFERLRPYGSEWCFTFVNTTGEPANGLYVKYSQTVTEHLATGGSLASSPDRPGRERKWYYSGITVPPGGSIKIFGRGDRGREMEVRKRQWHWLKNGSPIRTETVPVPADSARLLLRMPNLNNIGEELYAIGAAPLPDGIAVGLTDPVGVDSRGRAVYRGVIHPKRWRTVLKTLFKKQRAGNLTQNGPAACLDTLNGRAVGKLLRSLDPKKARRYRTTTEAGNALVGELLALKVNMLASSYGRTPPGFAELLYRDPGHPFDGMAVVDIARSADSAVSCAGGLPASMTHADLAAFLATLNASFSGPFDTASFAGPGGTRATGVRAVVMVTFMETDPATVPGAPPEIDIGGFYADAAEREGGYRLEQNYPNPFNPTTTIEFSLPEEAVVTIRVYNLLGQVVGLPADREEFSPGSNAVEFDAGHLASGVYFYHIEASGGAGSAPLFQTVRKMLLVR